MSRDLIVACAQLKNHNPEGWNRLLGELDKYVHDLQVACVNALPNDVQIAQGRAREAQILARAFRECSVTAEAIGKIQKSKP